MNNYLPSSYISTSILKVLTAGQGNRFSDTSFDKKNTAPVKNPPAIAGPIKTKGGTQIPLKIQPPTSGLKEKRQAPVTLFHLRPDISSPKEASLPYVSKECKFMIKPPAPMHRRLLSEPKHRPSNASYYSTGMGAKSVQSSCLQDIKKPAAISIYASKPLRKEWHQNFQDAPKRLSVRTQASQMPNENDNLLNDFIRWKCNTNMTAESMSVADPTTQR